MRNSWIFRFALWAEGMLERWAVLGLLLLLGYVVTLFSVQSGAKVIWFDEELGLGASMASTVLDVIGALSLPIDINPPLFHLLQRLSLSWFGETALGARLPALLGVLVFLCCLYRFTAKRLGPLYGLLAATFISCMPVMQYAWEGRPYGLILGLVGIALVGYQMRIDGGSRIGLWTAVAAFVCLPATHYYATLVPLPFFVAEVTRAWERKKFDWPMMAGIVIAPLSSLLLLSSLILRQRVALGSTPLRGSVLGGYDLYVLLPWVVFTALIGVAFLMWIEQRNPGGERKWPGFTSAEGVLALMLAILPTFGVLGTIVTGIYLPRYFIAACAGLSILLCMSLSSFTRGRLGIVIFLLCLSVVELRREISDAVKESHVPHKLSSVIAAIETSSLPVVFDDPGEYLHVRRVRPALAARLYYAADPEQARKLSGNAGDDLLMLNLAKLRQVQAVGLDALPKRSAEWVVVASNVRWLGRCLAAMRLEPGRMTMALPSSMTVQRMPTQAGAEWCEAPR